MGKITGIGWTDHTFNGWWGCVKVPGAPECAFCYAETFSRRLGLDLWGKDADRRTFGDKHWKAPEAWNRQAQREGRRHRVFAMSMADWAEDRSDLDELRDRLFDLIRRTPWLDWQLLTKRIENVPMMLPKELGVPFFVVLLPNWRDSLGTAVEVALARKLKVPVVELIGEELREVGR